MQKGTLFVGKDIVIVWYFLVFNKSWTIIQIPMIIRINKANNNVYVAKKLGTKQGKHSMLLLIEIYLLICRIFTCLFQLDIIIDNLLHTISTHTHTHTYIYIYIYVCVCVCVCRGVLKYIQIGLHKISAKITERLCEIDHDYLIWGGACSVMVIVVGNGHGDKRSNLGRGWLYFT